MSGPFLPVQFSATASQCGHYESAIQSFTSCLLLPGIFDVLVEDERLSMSNSDIGQQPQRPFKAVAKA